jgi:hypothetical protein
MSGGVKIPMSALAAASITLSSGTAGSNTTCPGLA